MMVSVITPRIVPPHAAVSFERGQLACDHSQFVIDQLAGRDDLLDEIARRVARRQNPDDGR